MDDLIKLAAAGQALQIILARPGVKITSYPSMIELVVQETRVLRITMDGDRDSHAPHVHIDIGRSKHSGSYTIHDGERVAGEASKYDKHIKQWILENHDILERVYRDMRANGYKPVDVCTLLETRFPGKK